MAVIIDGKKYDSITELLEYAKAHPEKVAEFSANVKGFAEAWDLYNAREQYDAGEIGAQDLLAAYGGQNQVSMNADTEKWLDNQIARENATIQNDREIAARDTSLLSAGSQLQQLGLSGSSVIQTGGASAGIQAASPDTAMRSNSALRQQAKINKYNQQMGLAKSLIGAASSMASSGIYGAALGAVKHSAQSIAGAAAHSGLAALKATKVMPHYNGYGNKGFDVDENGLLKI